MLLSSKTRLAFSGVMLRMSEMVWKQVLLEFGHAYMNAASLVRSIACQQSKHERCRYRQAYIQPSVGYSISKVVSKDVRLSLVWTCMLM